MYLWCACVCVCVYAECNDKITNIKMRCAWSLACAELGLRYTFLNGSSRFSHAELTNPHIDCDCEWT